MQNNEPLISLVVPVRNRADLLKRCLDSLVSQDFPAEQYEIIVCDDGSSEDLSGVIQLCRQRHSGLRLVKQDRLGPAAARNMGIRNSTAPLVLFIDSDVVVDKELVRRLHSALAKNPRWAGAEARLVPVEDSQGPLWEAPSAETGGRFHTAAIAYRREALAEAGGLDETFLLAACEDVELAARILPLGPIGFVPEARAFHPRRKVDLRAHWRSRLHWKYLVILAKRYGFLAFPERKAGRLYRLRLALAAVINLPFGRLLDALRWIKQNPPEAAFAGFYALFDVACGLCALPVILFYPVPERRDYLRMAVARTDQPMNSPVEESCR